MQKFHKNIWITKLNEGKLVIVLSLRGLDIPGRFFSTIFNKGETFCDFLFAFLHVKPLLKSGLL